MATTSAAVPGSAAGTGNAPGDTSAHYAGNGRCARCERPLPPAGCTCRPA